jgi:hypothetical protein
MADIILAMLRAITTMLALVAAGSLMAGCGGGKANSTASVTKAHAAAYARAINLRNGDVPGMSAASGEGETTTSDLAARLARCGGGLPVWETGSLRSARFQTDLASPRFEAVWSAIRVAPTAAVAQRRLAANQTPRVRTCIAHALGAVLVQRGPLIRESTSVSSLPTELSGVDGSFGLRLTHRLRYLEANPRPPEHTLQERLSQIRGEGGRKAWDVVGFSSGRVEIALMDFHSPRTTPLRRERRLLSLLYRRAKAHKL